MGLKGRLPVLSPLVTSLLILRLVASDSISSALFIYSLVLLNVRGWRELALCTNSPAIHVRNER